MDTIPSNHRLAERLLIAFVRSGEWRIDKDGRIWKRDNKRAEKRVPHGYLMIRKMVSGKRIAGLAHRLVWQNLHGDISPGLTINHINGIKDDNRPCNLQTMSMSDNLKHAHKTGLLDQHGERNPAAKLRNSQVAAVRSAYACGGYTMQQLADRFNISVQHVSKLIKGQLRQKQGGLTKEADLRHAVGERDPFTGRFVGKKAAGRLLDGVEWNEIPGGVNL